MLYVRVFKKESRYEIKTSKKIMKNIRLNPRMESLYGIGRAMKANAICIHHYARVDRRIKDINIIANQDPLLALKLLIAKDKRTKEKGGLYGDKNN